MTASRSVSAHSAGLIYQPGIIREMHFARTSWIPRYYCPIHGLSLDSPNTTWYSHWS